jgi:hypothetical protein
MAAKNGGKKVERFFVPPLLLTLKELGRMFIRK